MNVWISPPVARALESRSVEALVLIAVLTCIALLIQKEIAGGIAQPRFQRFSRALSVALLPLLVVLISAIVQQLAPYFR